MDIRPDLTASHDRVWKSLASPGSWLTARERIEVAREARAAQSCQLCSQRKAALSPNAENGDHATRTKTLSVAKIELIHRLVTDPGRITRSWVNAVLAAGVTDTEYVEIAGLVSAVLVVDTFHAALGLKLRELPTPKVGQPRKVRPRTALLEDSYVAMIPVDGLADDYADLYDTNNFVPNVHRAFSLVPDATRTAEDLMTSHYFPYEAVPRYTDADHSYAISKTQIELLASRVSLHNECFY